jgi:hypothetical protein
MGIEFVAGDGSRPRDLAWLDWAGLNDLSDDGKIILLSETGEGSRGEDALYLRKTDGSPAVRLGGGTGRLSPDGKWVIVTDSRANSPRVTLLPTRAGASKELDSGTLAGAPRVAWLPDSRRIALVGHEKDRPARCFVQDINGGAPRAITPEGQTGLTITPDGRSILTAKEGVLVLSPVEGGEPRRLGWKLDGAIPLRISGAGHWLYVQRSEPGRATIFRADLKTGKQELWKEVVPSDPVGVRYVGRASITPDGKTYAYHLTRQVSDLYLVEGLR